VCFPFATCSRARERVDDRPGGKQLGERNAPRRSRRNAIAAEALQVRGYSACLVRSHRNDARTAKPIGNRRPVEHRGDGYHPKTTGGAM
jgi:hypothetical protein